MQGVKNEKKKRETRCTGTERGEKEGKKINRKEERGALGPSWSSTVKKERKIDRGVESGGDREG